MINQIINDEIRHLRTDRYNNLELYDASYLKNPEHPATAFIFSQMMKCDPTCGAILNISSGLFYKVVQSYINGVWELKCDWVEIDEVEFVKHLTVNWVVWLEKSVRDELEDFEVIPSDEIYWENDIPTRIFEFQIWDDVIGQYDYYLIKKQYFIGYNETKLYHLNGKNSVDGKLIELDSLNDDTKVLDRKMSLFTDREETGMSTLSISIVEIVPIFDIIKSLVYAIERKIVMTNNESILFTPSKMVFKTGNTKKLSKKEIEENVYFLKPEDSVEYIKKENQYLALNWDFIEQELKLISANSDIPLDDLWFELSSSLWEDAQKIRRTNYENRIQGIRDIIQSTIKSLTDEELIFEWQPIGFTDKTQQLEDIKLAIEAGLMTRVKWISQYYDICEEEAQLILNDINNEVTQANENNAEEVLWD